MGTFFIGVLINVLGVLLVVRARWFVYEVFGQNAWAEKWLGPGQTEFMYKLIGIGLIFFGFGVMFGLWETWAEFALGGLFRGGSQ